jgi:prepilin signal peptidase PulO-like enzyme (type II secretory pathway)
MQTVILFIFGAALGSFINVVALRYDPEKFIFSKNIVGWPSCLPAGRSHCPHCKKNLRWFELIPLLSFVLQGGRCLRCRERVSFRYPIVEIMSGAIVAFVPMRLAAFYAPGALLSASVVWSIFFLTLLLLSLIDLRWFLIPDEINVALGALAIIIAFFIPPQITQASFLKHFGQLLGSGFAPWQGHIIGSLAAFLFFAAIIAATRGRGMGMGDLKLVAPLGLAFGWPDILIAIALAFVTGSIFGIYVMLYRGKTMKSAVPFGPFLALGALFALFCGYEIVKLYFGLFMG